MADRLRERIIGGELQPGEKLSQEHVQTALGVSRSTLREAFQVLIRERLLVNRHSFGVYVRELDRDDIADLYRARRIIECAAVQRIEVIRPAKLRALHVAVKDGQAAAKDERWGQVAAASIRFHEAVVALAESERLDDMVVGLLAEFRLAYAVMSDAQKFHVAFLDRHTDIAQALTSGDLERAASLLDDYLKDAEEAVLARHRPAGPRGIIRH